MEDHFSRLYGENAFADKRNYTADGDFAPHKRAAVRDHTAEAATRRHGYRRGFQALQDLLPTRDSADAADQAYSEKRSRLDTSRRNVSDSTDVAAAYNERSARLENAWRDGKKNTSNAAPVRVQDAAQAKVLADQAWQDRKTRLQNAWKQR
jgi:hypothetical protein